MGRIFKIVEHAWGSGGERIGEIFVRKDGVVYGYGTEYGAMFVDGYHDISEYFYGVMQKTKSGATGLAFFVVNNRTIVANLYIIPDISHPDKSRSHTRVAPEVDFLSAPAISISRSLVIEEKEFSDSHRRRIHKKFNKIDRSIEYNAILLERLDICRAALEG